VSRLETQAKIAWQRWGEAWARFAICSSCGEYVYCRGKRKNKMLCFPCFDENPPKGAV
jgi:formylmethanofuran dehydrogenase subunit E